MVSPNVDVPLPFEDVTTYPGFFSDGERPYGLGEEAGAYYYLSWNATSAEPVPSSVPGAPPLVDPPLVELSLQRTTCVK